MKQKQNKILFFINGSLPTEKQIEFSKTCKDKVCFRNLKFYDSNGCMESCDFVLGEVPEKYKEAEIPVYGKQEKKPEVKEPEIKAQEIIAWKPQVQEIEMKKIIYFTVGPTPTAQELIDIGILNTYTLPGYSVSVRNGAASAAYGYGKEAADLVAGTVPTSHNANTVYGVIDADRPALFDLSPSAVSLAPLATKQLYPIAVTGTSLDALSAELLAASVTYSSSVPAKATVSVGGLITAVATGSTIITATYEFESGKTVTATCAVTVTA